MGKYTSYYLYQKYEKIGSQDWTPVYPQTLSVYSDGTESGSTNIKSDNDTACGYKPSTEVQYRWVKLNPSTDYICDNCELWVASGYICDNGDLYEQLNEQNFDGNNWYYTGVKKKGKLIEENSKKCTGDTGSTTGGTTGSTTGGTTGGTGTTTGGTTGDTGTTTGDTPSMKVTYTDGSEKTFTGLTTIASDTDANKANAKNVEIYSGVAYIVEYAFTNCHYLTGVTLPDTLISIGHDAFGSCSSLSSITIPAYVRRIGRQAFYGCSNLKTMTVEASTPPTLGSGAIPSNVKTIYVPASSVNSYKSTSGWSTYASKIQAIP